MPAEREVLYQNINLRFDSMIEVGLLDEVISLLDDGLVSVKSNSIQSIGYKEMLDHISGKISLDEAVDAAKMSSRRYAKRQITWLRSMDDQYKLDPLNGNNHQLIEKIALNHFEAIN